MNDAEIWQLFEPLYDDIKEEYQIQFKQPMLALYTSLEVLETQIATRRAVTGRYRAKYQVRPVSEKPQFPGQNETQKDLPI